MWIACLFLLACTRHKNEKPPSFAAAAHLGVVGQVQGVTPFIAFDFKYPTSLCNTVFIAQPIDLAALKISQ